MKRGEVVETDWMFTDLTGWEGAPCCGRAGRLPGRAGR